ncbi:MAG: PilZ domain-containing protein [Myxococcales bacterium]
MEATIDPIRSAPRLEAAIPIRLPDGWHGEVINLSTTGMRVRSIAMLEPGKLIDATLEIRGREVPIKALVVWADPPEFDIGAAGEIGLALEQVSQDYLDQLALLFADSK